jgi:hypothetical protein
VRRRIATREGLSDADNRHGADAVHPAGEQHRPVVGAADLVPMMLEHLTRTGRALPESKMINVAVEIRKRRQILAAVAGR